MKTIEATKYKPYETYTKSGIEWLDAIPNNWELKRLKFLISQHITDGPHDTPEFIDEGVAFLSVDGIQDDKLVFEGCRYISKEDHVRYSVKCSPQKNDILLGKAASVGKVAIVDVDFEFSVWSPLALIRPNKSILAKFLYYSMKSGYLQDQIFILSTSNTQHNLSMDDIPELWISLPNLETQKRIVEFLDRETAKIDEMVAKKQKMMELLKEKRQALITHAVTKGLDSKAKMRPSGIDWLGDIPVGWDILPIWMLFFMGRGRVISNEEILDNPGEYPVYSSQTENNGNLGGLATYDFDGDYITWTTDGANAGTVFNRSGKFNCTNVCGTLKTKKLKDVDLRFFTHALNVCTKIFVRYDINPKLMNNVIAGIRVQVPPIKDQKDICNFLDRETTKIDEMMKKVETQIEKLQEYRQALITSAVTGKIMVN